MKNFTNNFKQFTSRLSARWLIMALILLVGTSSAWAVNTIHGNCDIYFDNSKTLWTDACIQFVIGHNSYSRTYIMTKQSDSNLYHVKLGTDGTNKWNDATYYAFIGTSSKWGDGGWGPGNITNAPHRTTTYTGTYDLNSGSSYYFVPTSSGDANKNGASFEIGTSYTQTYTVKKSESGTTGGTVQLGTTTLSTSDTSMDAGTYDLTITAPTGYNVSSVTVSGGSLTTAGTTGSNTYSGTVNVTAATTISVTYTCSPSTSIISAILGDDGKINLKGNFNTCIRQYHGFQWRIKGNDWCQENIPNDNSGYVSIYTNVNGEDTGIFEPKQGKTYEFRTYIYGNTWVYSSETIEVSTCTSIPVNAYAIAGNNEWTGNANPVTINYDANIYGTPTILYDGEAQIPTDVGTYAITINVPAHNGYCASTISLGDYEITCIDVAKPDVTASATICEGQVTLSDYNGNNANTVKWYSNSACAEEVTQPVTPTNGKVYYAKAYNEASGCYSSEYSTLTFTVNPLPIISISGSEKAVFYEDVTLNATATDGATVKWYEGGNEEGTGNTYVVTSATEPSKIVTAKAFLNGCESAVASHTVAFSAEDCTPEVSNDIQIKFYHPSAKSTDDAKKGQWWGMGTLYYSTNNSTWKSIDMGSSTSGSVTKTITNVTTNKLYVYFESYWTYSHNTKAKTNTLTLDRGNKYDIKITRHGDNNTSATATATKTGSLTKDPQITAPAIKMVSATYNEQTEKIDVVAAIYKRGCDDVEWGFQYSEDGTTWSNKIYPNSHTATVVGEVTHSFSIDGGEGNTYYIRAYAKNSNSEVTSANTKSVEIPSSIIESATISLVDREGNESTDTEVCPQSTVYLKVSYVGGDFKDYEAAENFPGTNLELVEHDKANNCAIFSYTATSTGFAKITISNDNTSVTPETGVNITVKEVTVATPPTIYLEKNTICDNQTTNVVVNSPIVGLSYSLKNGSVGDPVTYESGDLKFSVSKEGSYTVQVQETVCGTTAISVPVDLRVITSDVKITLTTDVNEISPWQPLTLTVKAPSGYDYDLQGLDGTVYTKSGDVYTIKFPRPDSWGVGNSASESEPKTFTAGIKAGEEPSCSTTTKEIQLVDTEEVCLAPGN